eukprot:3345311-Alexandrium_andersonii.AAC.1
MSASLVGSEMCIRDSARGLRQWTEQPLRALVLRRRSLAPPLGGSSALTCLLYTSDAADDM